MNKVVLRFLVTRWKWRRMLCWLVTLLHIAGNDELPQYPSDAAELQQYIVRDEVQTGAQSYRCSICQTFSHASRYHVRNHVESKHFPGTTTYNCDYCSKMTNTRKALNNHIYSVHKERQKQSRGSSQSSYGFESLY